MIRRLKSAFNLASQELVPDRDNQLRRLRSSSGLVRPEAGQDDSESERNRNIQHQPARVTCKDELTANEIRNGWSLAFVNMLELTLRRA